LILERVGFKAPSFLTGFTKFIRLRRRPRLRAETPGYTMRFGKSRHFGVQARALPIDECVTLALTLNVLKLVASADFASGG
jgi:hypothetical protein